MRLSHMSWPEVQKAAPDTVALLPIASIEQHSLHLDVSTDTAIATELAEAVEKKFPLHVVLCPTLCYGSSHHHLGFPGTMSIGAANYESVIVDLVNSLVRAGFRRIVLFNGHGGNTVPVRQALGRLSGQLDEEFKPNIALATYWELGGSAFAGDKPMESPALAHSCEYETSLMLHLFPDRVNMEKARRGQRPPDNKYIPWEEEKPQRGVFMAKQTQFISDIGGSGDPTSATAAKGRHLFDKAVAAATEFVADFMDWPLMPPLRKE